MSAAPETLPPPPSAPGAIASPALDSLPLSSPPLSPPPPARHVVHWFRKGLRLHDNPSLREGIRNARSLRCIFVIDPWFAASNVGINKWRFLLQCLEDLDRSLRRLNSRLFVVRGQPTDVLPKLFREWGTTLLTFEEDPEPFGRVRDHNITAMCKEMGIAVLSRVSHTLYKLEKIIERNGGKAPLTYHQFQALVAGMPPPVQPEPTITLDTVKGVKMPLADNHSETYGVPTLEELGFEVENIRPPVWVGGESEALARLEHHLERKAWVASFDRPKMTPQSLLASKTGVSPYLRFGCLSTRLFYYQLTELYKKIKQVQPPLSLHGQLLWREFFYCAATRNPNFDRMAGNPICVQIPWEKNPEALAKWANGVTGFPWIDAIMIQLREEGWVHHLARHAVACFLTRGDLWISWEEGMKVFDELLLDADWSVNAGTWMWLSCSSFFQQFFHCYCPVRFGRKADANGDFIRRYIPALKNMPTQYVHEPWMAPEEVQVAALCRVGVDYPVPMVDHAAASHVNIERIRQVYAILTKFKPHGLDDCAKGDSIGLNPQVVQRPNAVLSSPSPTSVITSINQSQYLCSQAPELLPIPQILHRKTNEENDYKKHEQPKPYKQVIVVRPDYGGMNKKKHEYNENEKSFEVKQEQNYGMRNLIINSDGGSSHYDEYQRGVKLNYYQDASRVHNSRDKFARFNNTTFMNSSQDNSSHFHNKSNSSEPKREALD